MTELELSTVEVTPGPAALFDLAAALLAGIVEAYEQLSIDLPARQYVVPGTTAAYDCDDGQVTVGVQSHRVGTPGGSVEDTTTKLYSCATDTFATLRVEIIRATPGIDDRTNPPSPADLTASARECLTDLALFRTLVPDIATRMVGLGRSIAVGQGLSLGADGYIAGSRIDVEVPVPD